MDTSILRKEEEGFLSFKDLVDECKNWILKVIQRRNEDMRKVEWISQRCDPKTLMAHQLMEDQISTCGPDEMVLIVGHKLYDGNIGSLPVVDRDQLLVGIVTEFDLLQAIECGKDLRSTSVASIMTKEVMTVTEQTPFMDVVHLLQQHHLVRVPVVRGKKLVGILARRDVILGYIKATDVGSGG